MRIAPRMIESGQGTSQVAHGRTLHEWRRERHCRARGMEVLLYSIFSYKAKKSRAAINYCMPLIADVYSRIKPNCAFGTDHLVVTGTIAFIQKSKQMGRDTGKEKLPWSVRRYVSGSQTGWRQSACFGGVWTLLPCIFHSRPPQRLWCVARAAQSDSGLLLRDQPASVT